MKVSSADGWLRALVCFNSVGRRLHARDMWRLTSGFHPFLPFEANDRRAFDLRAMSGA
jgi:hypothetical protein